MEDGTFSINLDNEFIPESERGSLFLRVKDGIIIQSEDTGIFDEVLPDVGSSGEFSTEPIGPITFNYDLGDFGKNVEIKITADGGVISVPESSSTLGLLFLGAVGISVTLKRKLKSDKSTDKKLD